MITSDSPERRLENDAFGVSRIADVLASRLYDYLSVDSSSASGSLVIGLEGPWGSGKTTLVEFLKSHFSKLNRDGLVTVVHFDP